MKEEKKFGSIKRFGTRYGLKIKKRISDVEQYQKKNQKCPYCSKRAVKRVAVGIWHCKKCNSKFTGNAYFLEERPIAIESEETEESHLKV